MGGGAGGGLGGGSGSPGMGKSSPDKFVKPKTLVCYIW